MNENLDEIKKDIKTSLIEGNAAFALDRLHTFAMKKIRGYCSVHNIDTHTDKGEALPLHSLIGSLTKYYSGQKRISEFSIQALKQSISIFEKFNDIRNKNSLAHDNPLLSNEESLYVVNCVTNMLNFLNFIETGESQLINISLINKKDVYEYICLNYATTTDQIAKHFKITVDETKNILMKLYKIDGRIKPAYYDCDPDKNDCQWTKCY